MVASNTSPTCDDTKCISRPLLKQLNMVIQATLLIGQYLFSEEMSGVDMNMQKKFRYNYQEPDGSFLPTEFR